MARTLTNLNHGRETYAVYYGDDFVLKRPLPTFGPVARQEWLTKQHKTKSVIDNIRAINNPVYNVPSMIHINDEEFQILEERAHGYPLTRDVYRSLSRRQQFEIQNSIGSFLVDMNESHSIGDVVRHKIAEDLKFSRLDNFIETKMSRFFNAAEIRQMARIRDDIGKFEYDTRLAWSHGDLNAGNVLYDPFNSRLSFIDFAEAGYKFIYRDIFAPLQIELDIYKPVYAMYNRLHDKALYLMPTPKNDALREIMKYRIMIVWLKRFIKAADDLRINPKNEKSLRNNSEKIIFMREQIQNLCELERTYSR